MYFVKIASNVRIESSANGTSQDYALPPLPGGHTTKNVGYQLRIVQASSTNAMAGIKLNHSPDGGTSVNHSTPIANTQLSTGVTLLSGDTVSSSVMVGEWLHPILTCSQFGGGGTREWVVLDAYEMRKPF